MKLGLYTTIAILVIGLPFGTPAVQAENSPLTVQIDPDEIICDHFLGFGVEWDSYSYPTARLTDNDYSLINMRVEWMRLPVARVMMQCGYCYKGAGNYDWNSSSMKALYRLLDECQKVGTTVLLTDWGIEPEWLNIPDAARVEDPNYAQIIGTYLDYLLNTRGYTCIKFFIMNNEPNLEIQEWSRWMTGLKNVSAEVHRRGLDNKVKIMGPDESTDEDWLEKSAVSLQNTLDAYDIHRYANENQVRLGSLYNFFWDAWHTYLQADPSAADKPHVVGEAGILVPGTGTGNNPLNLNYEYGLLMSDYAVQAVNAGSWSVLAWMLDDNSIAGFNWGMWKNKAGGFSLKPWFYPWSLLCRVFPAGSRIISAEFQSNDVRVLAAYCPGETESQPGKWSFCLVNRADSSVSVSLKLLSGPALTLQRYVYSVTSAAADSNGFPVPVDECTYDFGKGATVTCDSNSVVILTSIQLSGDINGDGKLMINDVIKLILSILADRGDPTLDFNQDGSDDIKDAVALAQFIFKFNQSGFATRAIPEPPPA